MTVSNEVSEGRLKSVDNAITQIHRQFGKGSIMRLGSNERENIPVIAAHIEGKARRGKPGSADERSIDAILPYAAHIVVNKDGDLDKKFTRFGEEHSIPVSYLDNAMDLNAFAKTMYAK